MTITSVRKTSKGIKITYSDGDAIKTLTSQEDPNDKFVAALQDVKELLVRHLQFEKQEKWLACTGVDTKFDKNGDVLYKVYANMSRPSWDALVLKVNTGWMQMVNDSDFFEARGNRPKDYPYLLQGEEVDTLEALLEQADEYLNGARFDSQPDLFAEEVKEDGAQMGGNE